MSNRGDFRGGSRGGGRGRGDYRGGGPPRGASPGGGASRGGPGFDRGRGRGGPGGGRGGPGGGGRGRGGPPQVYLADTQPRLDPRLGTLDSTITKFDKVAYDPRNPLRPGFGKLGTPIMLRANFFPVTMPKGPIYEYRVSITPTTDMSRLKARIFQLLEESSEFRPHLSYVAHDRSEKIVAAKKLPQPLVVPITFSDEGMPPAPNARTYTIIIEHTGELDTAGMSKYLDADPEARIYDPAPVLSALNLVLQTHASRVGYRVGKNRYFFEPTTDYKNELGLGIEAWKGFFTSVRPTYKQLMVNVNVCMTAFYTPGNLADAIDDFQNRSHGAMPRRFVKTLKIRTKHLGHKKPVKAIIERSARQVTFECEELGGTVSVAEYFKRKYPNNPLQYPDMPVVDIGTKRRQILVPAELCDILPGTPYTGKLDGRETANMIRFACNPPAENAYSIRNEGLSKLGLFPPEATSPLAGFGIQVSNEMTTVSARVLPAPGLSYRTGKPNVKDGGWNILDVKFQKGASLAPGWAVMIVRDGGRDTFQGPGDPRLVGFLKTFAAKLTSAGMSVPGAPTIISTDMLPNPRQDPGRQQAMQMIEGRIKHHFKPNNKPSFILVLLSLEDNYIYPGIKRLGDVVLGIHTVCMLLPKALRDDPKKQDQYFSNVALKVNTKLGGANHHLDPQAMKWLRDKKTMLVGCDVTHPGPASTPGTPSIVAVVASVDDNFVQFPCSLGLNPSKKEMIEDFDKHLIDRLALYKKKNKALPERVYVFRDGVSEGQFDTVLDEELPLMRKAFDKMYGVGKHPKLSIIICGKRHHARPFGTSSENITMNGNTKPGTVVDKGITDIYRYDFYLQAHQGLQGTVKSTHYTVVYDESRLGPDEIQQGTHTASYSYARATKAVSLIPPAYYADLACERGRFYLNDFLNLADEHTSVAGSGTGSMTRDQERQRVFDQAVLAWGNGIHDSLKESMFYI